MRQISASLEALSINHAKESVAHSPKLKHVVAVRADSGRKRGAIVIDAGVGSCDRPTDWCHIGATCELETKCELAPAPTFFSGDHWQALELELEGQRQSDTKERVRRVLYKVQQSVPFGHIHSARPPLVPYKQLGQSICAEGKPNTSKLTRLIWELEFRARMRPPTLAEESRRDRVALVVVVDWIWH